MEYLVKKMVPATLEIVYLVDASSEEEALTKINSSEEIHWDYTEHQFDAATVEVADQKQYSWLLEKELP